MKLHIDAFGGHLTAKPDRGDAYIHIDARDDTGQTAEIEGFGAHDAAIALGLIRAYIEIARHHGTL